MPRSFATSLRENVSLTGSRPAPLFAPGALGAAGGVAGGIASMRPPPGPNATWMTSAPFFAFVAPLPLLPRGFFLSDIPSSSMGLSIVTSSPPRGAEAPLNQGRLDVDVNPHALRVAGDPELRRHDVKSRRRAALRLPVGNSDRAKAHVEIAGGHRREKMPLFVGHGEGEGQDQARR